MGAVFWPAVSVIVPVYNEERYIAVCLQAIMRQDYPCERMEILVVDGMSVDRTRDIVHGFAERDARIRLLLSPKRRTPYSLNVGVAASSGEVLVRIDGHSAVAADHVRRCVEFLLQTGADHIGGLMRQRGHTFMARTIALALSSPVGVGSARFRYTAREQDIDTVPFGAYRRDTLIRLGGFDEAFPIGQDSELDYRITLTGGRVRINPAISTDYFCRDSVPALARQFFRYGRAKAQILHKHGGLPSPRALAPALFVTTMMALLLATPISHAARRALTSLLVAYTGLCLIAGIGIAARRGWRYAPLLPAIFAVLHISHGVGFLSQLPRFLTPRPSDRLRGSLVMPHTPAIPDGTAERAQAKVGS
jgi:cellulose synthase/poly-beta-1,6-N-acetylglucosamine synthase-like glycosyltransferase